MKSLRMGDKSEEWLENCVKWIDRKLADVGIYSNTIKSFLSRDDDGRASRASFRNPVSPRGLRHNLNVAFPRKESARGTMCRLPVQEYAKIQSQVAS